MKNDMTGDGSAGRRPTRRLIALVVALLAGLFGSLTSARGASAQESMHSRSPVWVVRFAGMTGATACPCHSRSLEVPSNRQLFIGAIGARWPLATGAGGFALDYEVEALPLILSRGTADGNLHIALCSGDHYCATSYSPYPWTTTAAGIGILPIGFTGFVPVAPHVRVQLRLSGGILRLSNPVPVAEGRKFNFMADGSATVELRLTSALAITAGLVQNHISNGNTATINPGMDSRMIEIGVAGRR
jgi:hypothetical protein